jgi:hypothetical protein
MVQPIQYQVPVADPFAGLLQGLKLGATVQDLQQAQAANELRRQQALQIQQKMEQQRQAQAELQRIEAIPEAMRSARDTQAYFRLVDPKAAENLLKYSESRTKEQRSNEARRLSQIWSALAADRGDIAQGLIQQMADAEQDPNLKNMYGAYADAAVKAPKALMSTIGGLASGLGKEYAESFEIARKAATPQGKIFASVEDKIRAGIVDEKGNALPGTYTRSESGTLQRISEKAPDQFGTYTQEQVAQRLGVPVDQVDPGLYSYNKTTQKYDRIGGSGTKIQIDTAAKGGVAYSEALGKVVGQEDAEAVKSARSAPEAVKKVDSTLRQLYTSKALTGAFADSIKAIERVRAKFGSDYAAGRVSDTEVLDAMLGSDVFPMIGELGIGARGLDTPAEREFLRQVMTGTVTMDKNSLIRLAEMRRDRIERNVNSFNSRLAEGELDRYFEVTGRTKRPIALPPRLKRPSGLLPPVGAEPAKTKPEQPTPGKPLGLGTRSIKGVVTPAESFPVAPQPQVSSQDIDAMINYWSQKYGIDR